MEIIRNFKKGIIQGLGIIFILLLSGISYAAWTTLSTETDGATITVDKWNAIINRLNSIDQNQLATAWVSFNGANCSGGAGSNECNIRDSYNITKVTKITTGRYRIYYTSMDNANYSVNCTCTDNNAVNTHLAQCSLARGFTYLQNYFEIFTNFDGQTITLTDMSSIHIQVFGGKN